MTETTKNIKSTSLLDKQEYVYAVGRRKESHARVRLYKGNGKITVNKKNVKDYFNYQNYIITVMEPLTAVSKTKNYDVSAVVVGGGKSGQAAAIRHGLSRCLKQENKDFKPVLKKIGLLKRDSRVKERKKYGLKKARRSPQWQKR